MNQAVPQAETLMLIRSRLWEHLSIAERRELSDAANTLKPANTDQPAPPALPDEVEEMVKRLRDASSAVPGLDVQLTPETACMYELFEEAAYLIERLAPRWTKVPETESLGAYLTGIPGQPIYAVDERTDPFSNWRLDLPPLPPQKGST